jgi:hypothetical protein
LYGAKTCGGRDLTVRRKGFISQHIFDNHPSSLSQRPSPRGIRVAYALWNA